jgi:CubicO group peptidase (beta-lactamase class C family)
MPDGPRSLPRRPSLRYLKLEAKRRQAAGEFTALHDAQAAIAREHGLPHWAALKQVIGDQAGAESHALAQLRWITARFAGAGQQWWEPPGEAEMRQHFDDRLLAVVPPGKLAAQIIQVAPSLREELVVLDQQPLGARVRVAGLEIVTAVGADPPYRVTGLRSVTLGSRVTDPRVAGPRPARTLGDVLAGVAGIAERACTELGLAGLALAGGDPGGPPWVITTGWADLDRAEALEPGHRFPATGITTLVTATAVLRLIADGRLGLGTPANDLLREVRLADDAITVAELLSHTAGVDDPAPLFADSVPDLAALTGPVVACSGPRGVFGPSNGGYAVLGQLIADVTASPYPSAVSRLVLEPLGLGSCSFPARVADIGSGGVTGYNLTSDGIFAPVPAQLCTIPAIGGLWTTPADLVRLATGWRRLLPSALARQALTLQAAPEPGRPGPGLGWIIRPGGEIALHGGSAADSTALLVNRVRDSRAQVVLTTRLIAAMGSIDKELQQSWTNAVR